MANMYPSKLAGGGGGGLQETTLWTNSESDYVLTWNGMAAQTITLSDNMSNYDYIEFDYINNGDQSSRQNYRAVIVPTSIFQTYTGYWSPLIIGIHYPQEHYSRQLNYVSDTQIDIGTCYLTKLNTATAPQTNNTCGIPVFVKGLK